MKRKLFLILILAGTTLFGHAQVSVQLILNPVPPARLSEWPVRINTVVLTVSNFFSVTRRMVIYSEIKTAAGDLVATRMITPAAIYSVPPGNSNYSARDVLPLNQMSFAGSYRSGLLRTGKLPQGTYRLSVQMLDSAGNQLTPLVTREFMLTGIQLPILFAPYDKQQIPAVLAQTAITFRWTNIIKTTPDIPSYNLQVFEVLPKQREVQALRANQPILNVIVKGNTQYIWHPQLLFNDSIPRKFIWTVKTTNDQGILYSTTDANPEGRSEPRTFIIATKVKF